ncbi:MAG: OmpA family protein [Thiothrix sp.]
MKTKSLLVLLLAGIWGVGSWWWYTCKVKGFCGADTTAAQVATGAAAGAAALSGAGKDTGQGTENSKAGETAEGDIDSDGDGVPDAKEEMLGTDPTKEDSDSDGISDFIELARDPQDTDSDGKIDAIDDDDDNDGVLTVNENADPNGDGNVDDAVDSNGNQIADYLDAGADGSSATQQAGTDKADADQAAEADQAKADADKAATDQAKADADKAAADQAKAEADQAKADADKVTMETSSDTKAGDIGPAILHFPTGSANPQLAATTKAYFEQVAKFLKDNTSAKVTIVGHTDNVGNPAKNKALGLKRAEMMQQMLIDLGAPKDRISASSEGPDKPVADNKTEEGRKKNRRVEITPVK